MLLIKKHTNTMTSELVKIYDLSCQRNKSIKWNNQLLANNPNFDAEIAVIDWMKNGTPWDFKNLSKITKLSVVEKYPGAPWSYEQMSANKNLNLNFVKTQKNKPWMGCEISQNSSITISDMNNYDFKPCLNHVKYNTSIDMNIVLENPTVQWNFDELSKRIPLDQIIKYNHFNWSYRYMSQNPHMKMWFVLNHLNENWDWIELSKNPGITLEDIVNNSGLDWNWSKGVSKNPNLTVNFALQNMNDLIWRRVSKNPGITMGDIESNRVSSNVFPWSWSGISGNPNLTFHFYENNPRKDWDYYQIAKNQFEHHPKYKKDDVCYL